MISKVSADWMAKNADLIERAFDMTQLGRRISQNKRRNVAVEVEVAKHITNGRQVSIEWIKKRENIISKPFPMK